MKFLFASLVPGVLSEMANGNAAPTRTPTTLGPFEGFPDVVNEEPEEVDFVMNGFRHRLVFN